MRRWLVLAMTLTLTACSTAESATETTMSDVASPSSSSTLTEDTTPGSPTAPSEPTTSQSPRTSADTSDITFTATANPETLVEGSPAEDAGSSSAIIAVDKASGKSAWRLDVPSAGWYWLQESAGMLIYSSQGEDASSIIAAVDLEGRPTWKTTTSWRTHGPFRLDEHTLVGTARAPFGKERWAVFALDVTTGSLLWSAYVDSFPEWGKQGSVVGDGTRVFVATFDGEVIAFDLQSGEVVWDIDSGVEVVDAPLVVADRLLVGGGSTLTAIDPATGEPEWTTDFSEYVAPGREGEPVVASPEGIAGGNAILWAGNLEPGFRIAAVDLESWDIRWTASAFRQLEVGHDVVVTFEPETSVDWPQTVLVYDGQSGAVLATGDLEQGIEPFSIAITDSSAYVGTKVEEGNGTLAAIGFATGAPSWTTSLRGSLGLIAIADGTVYVSASDHSAERRGALYAVDAATGAPRWSVDLDLEARTVPIIAGDVVVVVSAEEFLGMM